MDTSETYIKMCEKAGEIQGAWQKVGDDAVGGDFYFPTKDDGYEQVVRIADYEFPYPARSRDSLIFLPRQDQLQEMVKDRLFHIWGGMNDLYMTASTGNKDCHTVGKRFMSMEQLWLAFVMKEKFGKVWSNGEWIKE